MWILWINSLWSALLSQVHLAIPPFNPVVDNFENIVFSDSCYYGECEQESNFRMKSHALEKTSEVFTKACACVESCFVP